MAHYDVVPVDESDAWTYPPFEGRIEDGWVYGRGALDDKGPLLVVLEAVENLLAAGFTPARDVYLSFGGNEETYGAAAAGDRRRRCASAASCRGSCSTRAARSSTRRCRSLPGRAAMVGVGEKGVRHPAADARAARAATHPRRRRITAVGRIARAIDRLDARHVPPRARRRRSRGCCQHFANRRRGRDADSCCALLATFPALTARVFAGDGRRAGRARAHDRRRDHAAGRHRRERAAVAGVGDPQPAHRARRDGRRHGPARAAPHPRSRSSRSTVVESSEPSPESPTDNAQFALIAAAVKASYPDAATVPYV